MCRRIALWWARIASFARAALSSRLLATSIPRRSDAATCLRFAHAPGGAPVVPARPALDGLLVSRGPRAHDIPDAESHGLGARGPQLQQLAPHGPRHLR